MDINGSAKTALSTAYHLYIRKRELSRLCRLLCKFVILTILVMTLTVYTCLRAWFPASDRGLFQDLMTSEFRSMSSSGYRVAVQAAYSLMFLYVYCHWSAVPSSMYTKIKLYTCIIIKWFSLLGRSAKPWYSSNSQLLDSYKSARSFNT